MASRSSYLSRYRKKIEDTDGSALKTRMNHSKDMYNRNFKDIVGYRCAAYFDRDMVANGDQSMEELDIVISTNTNGYERIISCRPDTLLKTGTYIQYEEMGVQKTAIVRELLKTEPIPSYKAFECSQLLKIKNCPFPFPCFSYNSTYSSKGLVDTNRNYILDSRNKLYIQKNAYSCRLWEHYHGYRIILGDEDGTVSFKITEMDDFSYKGMFIVSLKVEQRHHLDGIEDPLLAWNEREIDFSDLLETEGDNDEGEEGSDNEETTDEPQESLELLCDLYNKVGDTLEVIASKTVETWDYDEAFFDDVQTLPNTFLGRLTQSGKTVIGATSVLKGKASKTIIVKEGGK